MAGSDLRVSEYPLARSFFSSHEGLQSRVAQSTRTINDLGSDVGVYH
jgi:hypothetical protein